jgi:hypothetical protein
MGPAVAGFSEAERGLMLDPQAARSLRALPETCLFSHVSLQADARTLARDEADYVAARAAYLARFPDAAEMFELRDFSILALRPVSARLVAGFGRACRLVGDSLVDLLRK